MKLAPFAAAAVLIAAGAAASTTQDNVARTSELEAVSGAASPDTSQQVHETRFRNDDNRRMTVSVRLSGKGPFRFLVDTGADRTAISRELAARLNLPVESTARLHSVTGISQVQTTMLPTLQFSRKRLTDVEAPLLERENIGADGILGVDSLRAQSIHFDFEARTMAIVPRSRRPEIDEEGTIVVEGRLRNGRLILTKARADDRAVTVVVDTGAQVCIGNDELREQLLETGEVRKSGKVELQSVTGEMLVGDYAFIEKLEIGGVELRDLAVVFADAHTFRKLGLDNRPALLLGMNAMRAFDQVTIDFARKKLRVKLPDQSSLEQTMMADRGSRASSPLMQAQ